MINTNIRDGKTMTAMKIDMKIIVHQNVFIHQIDVMIQNVFRKNALFR